MKLLIPAAVAVALLLAGCTATTPEPVPTTTPSSAVAGPVLDSEFQPHVISPLTAADAQTEGTRLIDKIQSTIGDASILSVVDNSQLVPATDDAAPYYAAARAYALSDVTDPLSLAEVLSTLLESSGWTRYDTTNDAGVYETALASGTGDGSWFIIITGNGSVVGAPTLNVQLGSPDVS